MTEPTLLCIKYVLPLKIKLFTSKYFSTVVEWRDDFVFHLELIRRLGKMSFEQSAPGNKLLLEGMTNFKPSVPFLALTVAVKD